MDKGLTAVLASVFIISLLLGMMFLSGHSGTAEKETANITVVMPFTPQIQWAPYYAAKYNGYYSDEGLNVDMQYSSKGGGGSAEQVGAGNADFGLSNTDNVITARSKEIPIVAIYHMEPSSVFYVISKKSKNITNPTELSGRSVGVISPASVGYYNLQYVLYLSNVSKDSVNVVQAGASIVPSFLEDKIDAAAIHLSQLGLIEQKNISINIIRASDYINASSGELITTENNIREKPEIVRKFIRATKRGLEYAVANPEKAVDIYIRYYPEAEKDRKTHLALWNSIIKAHGYDNQISKYSSAAEWEATQDLLFNIGMISKKTPVDKMFTNEFA